MMEPKKITCELRSVEEHGYPDMDELVGRVAFIFDGSVVSGWPLENGNWETDSDVGTIGEFIDVTHYLVFETAVWNLHKQ